MVKFRDLIQIDKTIDDNLICTPQCSSVQSTHNYNLQKG